MKIKTRIKGSVCSLRNSHLSDCKYILTLRTNPILSMHLNKVENNLDKSKNFILNQRTSKNKLSLTIIDKNNKRLGFFTGFTVFGDNKFDPGGWIMPINVQANVKICSLVLAFEIGFNIFNIPKALLRVRKGNIKIIKFHQKMGATIIDSDENLEYLIMDRETYNISLPRKIFLDG